MLAHTKFCDLPNLLDSRKFVRQDFSQVQQMGIVGYLKYNIHHCPPMGRNFEVILSNLVSASAKLIAPDQFREFPRPVLKIFLLGVI